MSPQEPHQGVFGDAVLPVSGCMYPRSLPSLIHFRTVARLTQQYRITSPVVSRLPLAAT